MGLEGYSSTPADVALHGTERPPRTDKGVHRRHRTLTLSRRSTGEASRFFAMTSATSAATAASRLIAASCAHPIFGFSAADFLRLRETLSNRILTQKDPQKAPARRAVRSQSVLQCAIAGATAHPDVHWHREGTHLLRRRHERMGLKRHA